MAGPVEEDEAIGSSGCSQVRGTKLNPNYDVCILAYKTPGYRDFFRMVRVRLFKMVWVR